MKCFLFIKPKSWAEQGEKVLSAIREMTEGNGWKVSFEKELVPTREQWKCHYCHLASKPFFQDLINHFSERKIYSMIIESNDENFFKIIRREVGPTNLSDPNSIRGRFGYDVENNVVHCSETERDAIREIANMRPDLC